MKTPRRCSNFSALLLLACVGVLAAEERPEDPFVAAARAGNVAKVQAMLAQGTAPNQRGTSLHQTALMAAADESRGEVVETLLAAGADPEARDEQGTTALVYASRTADPKTIEAFLRHGVRLNPEHPGETTPLENAVWGKSAEAVQRLLDFGADPNLSNENGGTPLVRAVVEDLPEIIKLLCAYGARVDPAGLHESSPLRLAIGQLQIDSARALVEAGADCNLADPAGGTPFLDALEETPELVPLMLQHGANPRQLAPDGSTTLMVALPRAKQPVLEQLAGLGVEIDARNRAGQTAMHVAASFNWWWNGDREWEMPDDIARTRKRRAEGLAVLDFLRAHQAELEPRTNAGQTPLFFAAGRGDVTIARRLLDAGADPNARDAVGLTPLHTPASQGARLMVQLLLYYGARAEAADDEGDTPLHLAARAGSLPCVKALLRYGAPVEVLNAQHQTPLWFAAAALHEIGPKPESRELIEGLLDAGAQASTAASDGTTPLMWAAGTGAREIADLLRAHGADESARDARGRTAADWEAAAKLPALPAPPSPVEQTAAPTLPPPTTLVDAVARGDEAAVMALLAQGAPVNEPVLGALPLHLAAGRGDEKIARALLAAGARVNEADAAVKTPLHSAVAHGRRALAELLLEHGAGVNGAEDQPSPLEAALEFNDIETGKWLLQHGADPNRVSQDGDRPLNTAVSAGLHEFAEALLAAGADPDLADGPSESGQLYRQVRDPEMLSLLRRFSKKSAPDPQLVFWSMADHAATTGDLELAKKLLAQPGFQIDAERTDYSTGGMSMLLTPDSGNGKRPLGYTFLSVAILHDQRALAKFLLEHGARPRGRTNTGATALVAVIRRGWDEIAEAMLSRGVELNASDASGEETAVSALAGQGDTRWLARLLDAGAGASERGERGRFPLRRAAEGGHAEAAKLLLAHGAAIDQATEDGLTPLAAAARRGRAAVCRLLLERGASVAAHTKSGETPLHLAAAGGYREVVEMLLAAGADPRARDAEGRSTWELAEEIGDVESAGLLRAAAPP